MRINLSVSSGTLAAIDNAVPGASQIILFIPGYTGSKEDFLPLLRPLGRAGYRAVAIDQRGQYESDWAASEDGYALDALAADVCELAAELGSDGSTLHLVGHSFGGLVARAAVLAKPELFADLVLMGSGPSGVEGERRAMLDAGELILAEHGMAALWDQLQVRAQADPRYVRPVAPLRAFLRDRFMATDPVGLRVMGNTLRTAEDRSDELAALGIGLLVLHGVDDDAWPPVIQADMAGRLGAAQVVVADAAHSPAVENPVATVTALIEFWQRSQA